MDIFCDICSNNRFNVVVTMVIKSWGIIVFELIRYVKFIQARSPVTQAKSLQVRGREVAYTCLRQRHEK